MIDQNLYITEEKYIETMKTKAEPYLDARRESGFIETSDGKELYYENYRADEPKSSIVILHGVTESVSKYHELAYYFLNAGANVSLLEQRGHGRSYREVDNNMITHIDNFERYVDDFTDFLLEKSPKDDLPRYLFAHSMGGGVGVMYMERYPRYFEKAVLSAPMIAPERGRHLLVVSRAVTREFIIIGKSKDRFFGSGDGSEEEVFEDSCTTSEARFDYYNDMKETVPEFKNSALTYRWVNESLNVTRKLLAKGRPEKIRTKLLLLQAERDTMVRGKEQEKFAARVPGAELVKVKGAKHEIYRETDSILKPVLDRIFEFYFG